jgi:hypothetical protein
VLQQFQLWRSLYDDGIAQNRSDLLQIDLGAYRKHQLQAFMLPDGSDKLSASQKGGCASASTVGSLRLSS